MYILACYKIAASGLKMCLVVLQPNIFNNNNKALSHFDVDTGYNRSATIILPVLNRLLIALQVFDLRKASNGFECGYYLYCCIIIYKPDEVFFSKIATMCNIALPSI